mgnify:CR=1 FL=1
MFDMYEWEHGRFIIDPSGTIFEGTGYSPEEKLERSIGAAGFIPEFLEYAMYNFEEGGAEEFVDLMCQAYGYGRHEMGGEVDGWTYKYPEDPDLEPIIVWLCPDARVDVALYNYGIIAVCDMDNNIVIRMD